MFISTLWKFALDSGVIAKGQKRRNERHLIIHAPGGSEQAPAAAPALPSLGPGCTAGPSPVLLAAARLPASGSLCFHPWSGPGSPNHLGVRV